AGDVGVAEEANRRVLIGETGNGVEAVEDVVPSLRRIERRVDNREIADLTGEWERDQPFLVGSAQLFAGPIDGHLGQRIEVARRFLEGSLFVVVTFHDRA